MIEIHHGRRAGVNTKAAPNPATRKWEAGKGPVAEKFVLLVCSGHAISWNQEDERRRKP